MSKIKLVALDMDGTLLNDENIVTDYTKKVLKRAIDQGVHIVLSTGRPLEMCISYVKDLELPSYVITSNGAEIFQADETLLEQHTIDEAKLSKLWEIGHRHDLHMWMVASDKIFYEGNRPDNFADYQWLKIGYGNLSENDKMYVMQELGQLDDLEITNSSLTNIEVNQGGVNKAQAIRSVCDRIGITTENVLAVGDSLNDYQMIKEAGIGVAVENAQKVILDLADHITLTNNDDGVAKAIERFALAQTANE